MVETKVKQFCMFCTVCYILSTTLNGRWCSFFLCVSILKLLTDQNETTELNNLYFGSIWLMYLVHGQSYAPLLELKETTVTIKILELPCLRPTFEYKKYAISLIRRYY